MDPENEVLVAATGNIVPMLGDEQPGYVAVVDNVERLAIRGGLAWRTSMTAAHWLGNFDARPSVRPADYGNRRRRKCDSILS